MPIKLLTVVHIQGDKLVKCSKLVSVYHVMLILYLASE